MDSEIARENGEFMDARVEKVLFEPVGEAQRALQKLFVRICGYTSVRELPCFHRHSSESPNRISTDMRNNCAFGDTLIGVIDAVKKMSGDVDGNIKEVLLSMKKNKKRKKRPRFFPTEVPREPERPPGKPRRSKKVPAHELVFEAAASQKVS